MSLVIPDTDENRNPIYVNTTKLLVKSSDETTNLAADRFQQGATLSQGEGSKIARGMFWSGLRSEEQRVRFT